MPSGVVKWFNDDKGFGFIAQDDPDEPDLFVHHSSIAGESHMHRTLLDGQRVQFEVDRTGEKGPKAIDVRPIAATGNDRSTQSPQGSVHGD